jgi:hypothetical protein
MGRKVSKVTKLEEESARDTMQRGIKHGSIQNTIDKTLDKVGDPVSERTVEVMKKIHPSADIAAPVVDVFMKGAILTGFAEIMGATKHVGSKIPGLSKIDEEKYDQLAAYIRSYAGQRTGTKSADAVFAIAPIFANMLTNPDLAKIFENEGDPAVAQLTEGDSEQRIDLEHEVAKLNDDDSENEIK